MRLLNIHKLQLRSFEDERKTPPYAILSHTWGDGELTFDELAGPRLSEDVTSQGVWKILKCTEQARKDGLEYVWIDTCCIQKSSSAELSEAINSMFRWYKRSVMCYAYLNDVPSRLVCSPDHSNALPEQQWLEKFSASRWFTRGWTLQELIAPRRLAFFSTDWEYMGTKTDLVPILLDITEIPQDTLLYGDSFGESVSRRMSWAAKRQTTRAEDMAYCLLGIFNINMPLLYGEGEQAFQRLQEEIVKITDDETIFAWKAETSTFATWRSLFARSPVEFTQSGDFLPALGFNNSQSHAITNQGLRIMLPLSKRKGVEKGWRSGTEFIATLKTRRARDLVAAPIGISIKKVTGNEYVRVDADQLHILSQDGIRDFSEALGTWTSVTVRQRLDYAPWYCFYKCFRIRGMWIKNASQNAKLEEVHPEKQWDAGKQLFFFNEDDMRCGRRQVVHCVFALKESKATLALYFNPREEYKRICCYYKVKNGSLTVDIESLLRVMDGDALLAVGLKVS